MKQRIATLVLILLSLAVAIPAAAQTLKPRLATPVIKISGDTLSWSAVEGARRYKAGSQRWKTLNATSPRTSHSFAGLAEGESIEIRVRATAIFDFQNPAPDPPA